MKKYVCDGCGWVYDPVVGDPDNSGIAPGTAFEDIPDDWECPRCGAGKDEYTSDWPYKDLPGVDAYSGQGVIVVYNVPYEIGAGLDCYSLDDGRWVWGCSLSRWHPDRLVISVKRTGIYLVRIITRVGYFAKRVHVTVPCI